MKFNPVYIAITSIFFSQVVSAETKTLDFYPSGANRYSISGTVKDLDLPVNQNSILIKNANSESYVRLNEQAPYHLTLIDSDLNFHQIIDFNKGKLINYKDKQVKLVGAQGDKVIAEFDNQIIFIPINEITIPKSFLNDTQKGLKATFINNINPNDNLYFSQSERQLNYKNTYESILKGDAIKIVHYLNINNASQQTFDNVYLTFFLSETNIQEYGVAPMLAMPKAASARMDMAVSNMAPPVFDNSSIQGLKNISIKEPVTIYPNFNKIKYSEKSYKVNQFVKMSMNDNYDIYLEGDLNSYSLKDLKIANSPMNINYLKELKSLKERVKDSVVFENKIAISLNNDDLLPSGKFDIYETEKNQDKLIVSTNIGHTENKNLEILKSRNNDLKIVDLNFEIVDALSLKSRDNNRVNLKLKDMEIQNTGDEDYLISVFDKKIKVGSQSKTKIIID